MIYAFCMGMFNSSDISLSAIDVQRKQLIAASDKGIVFKQINTKMDDKMKLDVVLLLRENLSHPSLKQAE